MENKRLFISLPIESGLVKTILKSFDRLNLPKHKLRVVPAENYHLTIKFLGDMPLERIPDIIEVLKSATTDLASFDLTIDKPTIFPTNNNREPRGLTIALKPNEKLQALFDKVEDKLWRAGLANKEMRRFTPHITISRIKQSATQLEFSEFLHWPIKGNFSANSLQLQESILGKHGPEYFVLETFEF